MKDLLPVTREYLHEVWQDIRFAMNDLLSSI